MGKPDNSKPAKAFPKKHANFLAKRVNEGSFILALACSLFVLLALSTYQSSDPGWSHSFNKKGEILNGGGQVGAYLADALYFLFGYFAYLLPIGSIYVAWRVLQEQRAFHTIDQITLLLRSIGLFFLMIAGCSLLSLKTPEVMLTSHSSGGFLGDFFAKIFQQAFNVQGATLVLLAIFFVGVTWLTGFSWVRATESIGFYSLFASQWLIQMLKKVLPFIQQQFNKITIKPQALGKNAPKLMQAEVLSSSSKQEKQSFAILPPVVNQSIPPVISEAKAQLAKTTKEPRSPINKLMVTGSLPELSLLDKGQPGRVMGGYNHQELEAISREVEQHLLDFGIQADVVAVHPGPVVTRYELQLAAGIKVSKLSVLAKDLARSLSVISVRVVEVIPGKTVVGIELPNQHRETVCLFQVLSADVYQQAHSPLTIALGVDIAGHPMVVDLAKMPHLLVAGTTGSGKSVGINAMILSLLFKATPEQVRLIMIDPKMLELSVYEGIPHLLTPVVTDMKEAASALRWCVAEMERRYRLMAALGVRNLAGYNAKVSEALAKGEPIADPMWKPVDSIDISAPLLETLPYVVVIIDELADMMMVVGKKVEQLIARIAQKARAAGLHLILATQRPSVDVLTGLIKSNIPTRISFQVSSKIDSRTILDQQGAEQLLGHGDMLYLAPGSGAPLRVHGAFVDDKEVHRIADDWRARGEPNYLEEITQGNESSEGGIFGEEGQDTEDSDPLYDQAVEFVLQTRKASISSIQRRLKVGYNRAARLVEEMERTGIVGPLDGGFREVLVQSAIEE